MHNKRDSMTLSPIDKEILLAESARSKFLGEILGTLESTKDFQFYAKRLEKRIFDLEHSLSWKITSPIRSLIRKIISTKKQLSRNHSAGSALPLVSIAVTTYNQPQHQIEHCIESLLRQTFTNFKLHVWDDGSSNLETLEFLRSLTPNFDPRIEVTFSENRGVISARNSVSKMCNSKYIAFLDPDDYLERTFLEKVVIFAESHAGTSPVVINTDVNVHGHDEVDIWETAELSWPEITNHNQLPICSLVKLSEFLEVGGFSDQMNEVFEDWELWTRLASRGFRSKRIAEPLFHYSYQQSSGRDAAAKIQSERLQTKIKVINSRSAS